MSKPLCKLICYCVMGTHAKVTDAYCSQTMEKHCINKNTILGFPLTRLLIFVVDLSHKQS